MMHDIVAAKSFSAMGAAHNMSNLTTLKSAPTLQAQSDETTHFAS
jgi:hypothetical protein